MEDRIALRIRDLSHHYGPKKVLHDIDLRIVRGQIVALVGPSGCGKSTLLKAILGTQAPSTGMIRTYAAGDAEGQPVDGPGRERGIVYQRYALYPYLTALENVAVGLKLDETTFADRFLRYPSWRRLRKTHLELSEAALQKVGLGDALHRYPHELSGGMQQRVAIAQALVMKPEILLLDEPFGALDEATREELQSMLLGLYQENIEARKRGESPPYTIMIVTHELNEAIYVGDRVIGLSQYWAWDKDGHEDHPGASIVYDRPTPLFDRHSPKEYEQFVEQREQIRAVVFEPEPLADRTSHVVFWDDVKDGRLHGILGY